MAPPREVAALVALLRLDDRRSSVPIELIERQGSALSVLSQGGEPGGQTSLMAADPEPLLRQAEADVERWRTTAGFGVLTILDAGYPQNLRGVHDRPPLLFVHGRLQPGDARSVAVIGSRHASRAGVAAAERTAHALTANGFVVVSGLASGIDTAAHTAALDAGGRTLAVIGTGLAHSYPPQNADLQSRIARDGAVLSQFWPETPPSRTTFPLRNAVMSGITRATVIIEASLRSGARVQARHALAHGRPVFLVRALLAQPWARELAGRPGVHVVDEPEEIVETVERLDATDALVE